MRLVALSFLVLVSGCTEPEPSNFNIEPSIEQLEEHRRLNSVRDKRDIERGAQLRSEIDDLIEENHKPQEEAQ